MLRTVIVDDSPSCRSAIRAALAQIPGVEVIEELASGAAIIARAGKLDPDVIVLDIEMPQIDGLKALEMLRSMKVSASVLIISGYESAPKTLRALGLGALEVIRKPRGGSSAQAELLADLRRGIAVARARANQKRRAEASAAQATPDPSASDARLPFEAATNRGLVVVGVSTGGPAALGQVVGAFDASFDLPILIVQHMPPNFTQSLASSLGAICRLDVAEAKSGDELLPGRILIAAGGYHLELDRDERSGLTVRLTDTPPVEGCRPSVDRLFLSAAAHFEGSVLAVIMTGMGRDGLAGMRALRERGAHCVAQDQATSVVFGMPRAVLEAGLVDEVLPLQDIGPRIQAFGASLPKLRMGSK